MHPIDRAGKGCIHGGRTDTAHRARMDCGASWIAAGAQKPEPGIPPATTHCIRRPTLAVTAEGRSRAAGDVGRNGSRTEHVPPEACSPRPHPCSTLIPRQFRAFLPSKPCQRPTEMVQRLGPAPSALRCKAGTWHVSERAWLVSELIVDGVACGISGKESIEAEADELPKQGGVQSRSKLRHVSSHLMWNEPPNAFQIPWLQR